MTSTERLREHPAKRFEAKEQYLDLNAEYQKLLQEGRPAVNGHRQETIYKHGEMTLVIFAFEAGGFLHEHVVPNGAVVIRAVDGAFEIKTPDHNYQLGPNGILLLAPGVKHDVLAREPGRLLVSVHLDEVR